MNRLGRVVAKNNHALLVKLQQTEKCAECPANCNKPLIDLFSLHNKLFLLTSSNLHYELIDSNKLIGGNIELERLIHISVNQKDLMISSGWMYLLPLIICISAVVIGHFIGVFMNISPDLFALLGLIMGFVISFFLLRKKITTKHLKIRPKVTIL